MHRTDDYTLCTAQIGKLTIIIFVAVNSTSNFNEPIECMCHTHCSALGTTVAEKMSTRCLQELAMCRTNNDPFCHTININELVIIIFVAVNITSFLNKCLKCVQSFYSSDLFRTLRAMITIKMAARSL